MHLQGTGSGLQLLHPEPLYPLKMNWWTCSLGGGRGSGDAQWTVDSRPQLVDHVLLHN